MPNKIVPASGVFEDCRDILESLRESVMILDRDMNIIYANKNTSELLSLSNEKIIGNKCFKLFHGTDAPPTICPMAEAVDLKKHTEAEVLFPSGKWYLVTIDPILDPSGPVAKIVHRVKDITERKLYEEKVKERETFLQEIVTNVKEGIVVYDKEFRYVFWNSFMEALTGMEAKYVIGKVAFDVFPHLKNDKTRDSLKRAMSGEVVKAGNVYFQVPGTGKEGWVSATYSPHYDSKGSIVGVIGLVHDISDMVAAEESLIMSKERYSDLFENANDIILTFNIEGKITSVNRAFCSFFEYSKDESLNMGFGDLLSVESKARAMSILARAMREKQDLSDEQPWEFTIIKKSGDMATLEVRTRLTWEKGNVTGVHAIARDITDRIKLEADLRRRVKELEIFNEAAVGRELKMMELKKRIKELEDRLNK